VLGQQDVLIAHRLVDQRQAIGTDLTQSAGRARHRLPIGQLRDGSMGQMKAGIADQRGVELLREALDGHHAFLPALRPAHKIGELRRATVIGADQRLARLSHRTDIAEAVIVARQSIMAKGGQPCSAGSLLTPLSWPESEEITA
jgi:hypothetical protein